MPKGTRRRTPNLIDCLPFSEMPAYELGCRILSHIAYPELHPKTEERNLAFLRAAISDYLTESDYLTPNDDGKHPIIPPWGHPPRDKRHSKRDFDRGLKAVAQRLEAAEIALGIMIANYRKPGSATLDAFKKNDRYARIWTPSKPVLHLAIALRFALHLRHDHSKKSFGRLIDRLYDGTVSLAVLALNPIDGFSRLQNGEIAHRVIRYADILRPLVVQEFKEKSEGTDADQMWIDISKRYWQLDTCPPKFLTDGQ